MVKRKFICRTCRFKATSPTSLHAHYKENPSHTPRSSVLSTDPYKHTAKQKAKTKRPLNMSPAAVRAMESLIEPPGKYVDRRIRANKVTKRKEKPNKRLSQHPSAKRSRQYRKAVNEGKHKPKPHSKTHRQPEKPEPELVPQMSGCNFCPHCGFNLQPTHVGMQMAAVIKEVGHA